MKRLALPGSLVLFALSLLLAVQMGRSQENVVEAALEMAPVPTDCGLLVASISPAPGVPNAIGANPLWVGITDGVLPMPTEHYQVNPQLEGWWSTKVGWLIPKWYTGEVQMRSWNVADDTPMYFEFGEDEPLTTATLDPDEPGGFVDGLEDWAFFPSYVWVARAGCYRLHAEWDGGLWEQVIAVGSAE